MARREQARLGRDWDDLAQWDAYGAILFDRRASVPWSEEEFFRTGAEYWEKVMSSAAQHGRPTRRQSALDYGSGVGRITRQMAGAFETCHGIDVSRSMVERATKLNRDCGNCRFDLLPDDGRLPYEAGHFDLVHCGLVLQHLPDRLIVDALNEMFRVAAPDGMVVFQLPHRLPWRRRLQPRRRLYDQLRAAGVPARALLSRLRLQPVRMNAMDEKAVRALVKKSGGTVLEAIESRSGHGIEDRMYYCSPGPAG